MVSTHIYYLNPLYGDGASAKFNLYHSKIMVPVRNFYLHCRLGVVCIGQTGLPEQMLLLFFITVLVAGNVGKPFTYHCIFGGLKRTLFCVFCAV